MAEKEMQIVYTVPNQKVVKVKHDICDKSHPYTMCNVKSNSRALKELSPNTYKLYMYFDLNQDGYTFALSYQAVHNATGMSDKTYQKAVRELIEKKYLVPSETKGLYIFYNGTIESEDRKVENTQQEEKELLTDNQNGFPKEVKKEIGGTEEITGEILQNIKNNTIDNKEIADAQTVASLQLTSLEEIDFKCKASGISNETARRVINKDIKELQGKDKDCILNKVVENLTGVWYQADKEAVIRYTTEKLKVLS